MLHPCLNRSIWRWLARTVRRTPTTGSGIRETTRPRSVRAQEMVDQTERVGALDEECGGSGLLDGIGGGAARLHRQAENLDLGELGANPPGRFDPVHMRHRDVHQD